LSNSGTYVRVKEVDHRRISLLALLLALGLALGTLHKAKSLGSPDFQVFYTAAQHALHDPVNIYKLSPDRYLYPPSTALVLTPFAFSENYAFHQWSWHGLLAAILFILSSTSGAALAAMLLLVRYLAITFSYGQINLVVMGLLALVGFTARSGSLRPAGAIWALAMSLKVYPAVLAPFFFTKARWRAFSGMALGSALLLFMPFAFFGLDLGAELYGEFFAALRAKGLPLHSHNQSIAALLLRVCTNQEFYLHAVGPEHWGLVNWPVPFLRLLAWVVGGALTFATWWKTWKRGLSADAALSAAAFSILFLSHIVWKDYLLFLYFPLKELFALWPRRQSLWIAGIFLVMITLSSPDVVGHPLSTRLDAACIHLWAAVLIWGAWWKAR
jgi:hypothetical protein